MRRASSRNDGHKQLLNQVDVWGGAAKLAPRIFCGIYTYQKNHQTKVKVSNNVFLISEKFDFCFIFGFPRFFVHVSGDGCPFFFLFLKKRSRSVSRRFGSKAWVRFF